MKTYKQAVLPIALRVALFFPGVSANAAATSPSPCSTPNPSITISDNQTEPCNLSNNENLTIRHNASINVPTEADSRDLYNLKYSAVNIGNNNDQPPDISVNIIKNYGSLSGSSGVTVTHNGSVGRLINSGVISGTQGGAVWVSGHMDTLYNDNNGTITYKKKDIAPGIAVSSIMINKALGNSGISKHGSIDTVANQGRIDGISVTSATLKTLKNHGTLASLKDAVGNIYATINVDLGGSIGTIHNNGIITGPNQGILVRAGGHLEKLENLHEGEGIYADVDAIQVIGQGMSLDTNPQSRPSKINQITNESNIHGKQNGIYIDDKGVVDTITNLDGGVIQGVNYSILNNGSITDGIYNKGIINGSVELGNARLYMSGPNAILNGSVSGTGSFVTIGGKGTITDNLDLTYTHDMNIGGIKIFSGSALRLGDGHKTGSVSNDIDNEGQLYFNRSDNVHYNHIISGFGSVHQTGSGTVILTNKNTYTGETNIESGTLQLGDKGTTGSIDNTAKVVIGQKGSLAFDRSNKVRFSGNIEGTGSLRQQGSGVLTLTGNVTTGKPITVTSGELRFGDGTTIGKLSLAGIENQGAVIVSGTDDSVVTLDGEISGTGTLEVTGGKTVLTSDNTYSGQTIIGQRATLQLGNTGSAGNLTQSNIINSGMLAFNHTNSKMTYSKTISGSGSVAQIGTSGTTILDGQNTYTGATTIKAGTLQFDSWTNMPQVRLVDIEAEGKLALNLKGTNRFDGVISGRGHIKKMGTGITTLGADSADFIGSTHVEAGTFIVDGQLGTSMLRVQSGGTVAGTGTIGTMGSTTTIENGGYLAGHQGNTLTFGDNLILSKDAHVDIALGTPETSAPTLFKVHGNLTLAGTMNVTELGGFSAGEYDIFHYSGKLTNKGMVFTDTNGESSSLFLDASRGKKVYLINTRGNVLNYWAGGNGIWQVDGAKNWTSNVGYPKTSWHNTDQFAIFSGTAGTVKIDNGGGPVTVNGLQFSSDGYTITGQPLTLENDKKKGGSAKIRVGTGNKQSSVGSMATIESVLTGAATLETTDYGKLVLTGKNTYTGNTKVTRGTLQIGDGSTRGSISGDVEIGREGTLVFDRTDKVTFNGNISGKGQFVQNGENTLVLTGTNSYTGMTDIRKGTLSQGAKGVFSTASSYTVGQSGTFDMGGFDSIISALDNNGKVLFGNGDNAVGRILTVAGNYSGNNGTVNLSTVLAEDNSKTDRLVVSGNTSGTTHLAIKNVGSAGAPTKEGIKIVDVKGSSDGTFNLVGDYSYKGDPAIVAGAYAYRLYKNGSDNADGSWYLRSSLTSPATKLKPVHLYQAGVSIYEIYGRVLQVLNAPESLHNRSGNSENRQHSMNGFKTTTGEDNTDNTSSGVWGQITASHGKLSPRITTAGTGNITYNMTRAQVGVDKRFYNDDLSTMNGGIFLQYADINADAGSVHGDGNIRANGYTLGTISTWYRNNGLYVDGLAQLSYFNSDLNSKTAGQRLGSEKSAFGYALSLESGRRIDLTPVWSLTPQIQLVYSSINMKDFDDRFGAKIRFDQSRSMKLRVGTTIDYSQKWHDDQNRNDITSNLYSFFNIRQDILRRSDAVNVADVTFHGKNDQTWGETGVGGSYSRNDSRFVVYGQISTNTSLNNFTDSYELSGKIGLNLLW